MASIVALFEKCRDQASTHVRRLDTGLLPRRVREDLHAEQWSRREGGVQVAPRQVAAQQERSQPGWCVLYLTRLLTQIANISPFTDDELYIEILQSSSTLPAN